jgi:Ni,Fe-hydrogenase I small subunit
MESTMKRVTWTDRAVNLSQRVEHYNAPREIVRAADDAIQHFVWATGCRRQANNPKCKTPGWGAKADKAHYHGKKCFAAAQKWLDDHLAALAAAGDA